MSYDKSLSRRKLIATGLGGTLVITGASAAANDEDELEAFAVPLSTHEALAKPGGSAIVELPDGTEVIVARVDDEHFIAAGAICTHNGCRMEWDARAGNIVCGCHGSRFAIDGTVVAGPARRPVPAFKTDTAVAVLYQKADG